MKRIIKGAEPAKLTEYRQENPAHHWEDFTKNKHRHVDVQNTLKLDQGGLCAYCEIDLLEANDSQQKADFRVEHFHPKSDENTETNWHLAWQNLLGCCHGGSERHVQGAEQRFTSPDHSCDVPKGNNVLDGIILNPLTDIPAFPCLFECQRHTGKLLVHVDNCRYAGVSIEQTEATIEALQLSAPTHTQTNEKQTRLMRFRKSVLDKLNDELYRLVEHHKLSISEARFKLAQVYLAKNDNQHWPAFFTSIRSYLGSEAETHLKNINYQG